MKLLRTCRAVLIYIICLLPFGPHMPAHAQNQQQPGAAETKQQTVKLNVLVLDDKNHPVTNLRQEDFQLMEGDAPVAVSYFAREEHPVSYGLLIDSSGSLRTQFKSVLETAKIIINDNRTGDETFLMRFVSSDKLEMVQTLTSNKKSLTDWLNLFRTEGGLTALVDAIAVSAEYLMKNSQDRDTAGRRLALVVITDGEDRGSTFRREQVIKDLRNWNIQVFSIGFIERLDSESGFVRKSPREQAIKLLEDLAKETGGHAFLIRSPSDLVSAVNDLPGFLHTQYVVGYNPTGAIKKDAGGKVRVKVVNAPGREKMTVVVRPIYSAK